MKMKKIIVVLIVLLVIGAYLVKTYNDLDLKNPNDLKTFIKVYSAWIFNLGENAKDVTGYVSKKQWLPENNQTNSSSS